MPPRVQIVVWSDISIDQMKKLDQLEDAESINNFFIKIFHLEQNTKRTTILCDLYYYAVNFSRTNKFTHEQTSTFISILKRVHEMATYTSFANMGETYKYFKDLLLRHSLSRPPYCLRIFTPDLTKLVTDYVVDTYFRHYKMYKYIFTPLIDYNLKFTFDGMTRDALQTDGELAEQIIVPTEEVTKTSKGDADQRQQEPSGSQVDPQLTEVRKLIQTYVRDEIRKMQTTTEEPVLLRPPTEKRRSAKSSSTKTSKSHTPK